MSALLSRVSLTASSCNDRARALMDCILGQSSRKESKYWAGATEEVRGGTMARRDGPPSDEAEEEAEIVIAIRGGRAGMKLGSSALKRWIVWLLADDVTDDEQSSATREDIAR